MAKKGGYRLDDNHLKRQPLFYAVLIFSGIVVGTIGGMAILVHFFGAWAIFGVPAGLIIAMDSKR